MIGLTEELHDKLSAVRCVTPRSFFHFPTIPRSQWFDGVPLTRSWKKKSGRMQNRRAGEGGHRGKKLALPRPKRSRGRFEFVRVQRARVDAARWLVRSFVRSFVVVSLTTT